jgi:hypothetical protein
MARENVLVVDGEEDILEIVNYDLTKAGYPVTDRTSNIAEDVINLVKGDIFRHKSEDFSARPLA